MGWHLKIHLFFSLSMNFLTKPVLFVFSVYDNCHSCSVFCFFPFLFSDVALLAIIQNKIWHKLAKCLYKIVKTIKKLPWNKKVCQNVLNFFAKSQRMAICFTITEIVKPYFVIWEWYFLKFCTDGNW
jgi:hypothetical protein